MKVVLLAALSAVGLAAGVAMIYLPAGVIAASVEGLIGAYVVRYLEAAKR